MPLSLEMFRHLDHPVDGVRVVAVACGTAADIASITDVLTPTSYTSAALVLIQPPTGSDPHGAMAVSPIYLSSIKLYDLVAWGDHLFLEVIDNFKLPRTGHIERLKPSVRKATVPRNTKVLRIYATLHATPIRALTLYIAKQTVKSARDIAADTLERSTAPHTVAHRWRVQTRND